MCEIFSVAKCGLLLVVECGMLSGAAKFGHYQVAEHHTLDARNSNGRSSH